MELLRSRLVIALELLVAAWLVVADRFVPTLLVLALAAGSLLLRREWPASIGFRRPDHPLRLAGRMLVLAAAWSLVQLGLILPVLERVTGERRDVDQFAPVEGDVGLLLALLALSWTLAAIGEETVYRGYLLTRARELLEGPLGHRGATLSAVVVTSVLFGLAHTEQGAVGVLVTQLDGLLLGWLRVREATVWAAVLMHGFINTLGLMAYFAVGPVGSLW
jgi:membrane protease YdiL (CAAX protease family)